MQTLLISVEGINPLLQNNPQTVDRFNKYTQAMAKINAKGKRRTDDDYREMADIEVRAKVYFDETLGVYIPATWVTSAICKHSFAQVKVSKEAIRGAVFPVAPRIKLNYRDQPLVKSPEDIVGNHDFRIKLTLKQGQVRVCKSAPIFHDWSFDTELEFDDKIIDPQDLARVIEHASKYGGFGDFRPSFGRAIAECSHV
jgi:hypothetical protein